MSSASSSDAAPASLGGATRWVLLLHETPPHSARPTHFDFMLEEANELATWACASNLFLSGETAAKRINDHRKAYLDFEGEISGNRGVVRRIAEGLYQTRSSTENAWVIAITGDFGGVVSIPRDSVDEVIIRYAPEQAP